jgi:hypothetical protein
VADIHRFPEKKPDPVTEEQEELEFQEALRSASAPQKKATTDAAGDAEDADDEPGPGSHPLRKKKHKTSRVDQFYYCPSDWVDRAATVLTSATQLLLALRLYRRWKTRSEDGGAVVSSSHALGFDWRDATMRKSKTTMLRALEAAKLVRIESGGGNRSPRVCILE